MFGSDLNTLPSYSSFAGADSLWISSLSVLWQLLFIVHLYSLYVLVIADYCLSQYYMCTLLGISMEWSAACAILNILVHWSKCPFKTRVTSYLHCFAEVFRIEQKQMCEILVLSSNISTSYSTQSTRRSMCVFWCSVDSGPSIFSLVRCNKQLRTFSWRW
jgi:hypothetical protein